jgi:hypothetical protein
VKKNDSYQPLTKYAAGYATAQHKVSFNTFHIQLQTAFKQLRFNVGNH